jgi:hypothetical protein
VGTTSRAAAAGHDEGDPDRRYAPQDRHRTPRGARREDELEECDRVAHAPLQVPVLPRDAASEHGDAASTGDEAQGR